MLMMILGSRLEVRHLPSVVLKENGSPEGPAEARSLSAARLAFDRDYILKKLEESGGNVSRTADALGIERSHLYRKLKSLRINLERN